MPTSLKLSIETGSHVSLFFSLSLANGELIDGNFDKQVASFRLGDGSMLHGFEEHLLGLQAGDEVEARLEPEQAFGEVNLANIHRFPIAKFKDLLEDELIPTEVGSVLSFKDAGGFDLPGVVKELTESTIIVDFNHPLAGKVILFKAQVVSVMAADVETVEVKL